MFKHRKGQFVVETSKPDQFPAPSVSDAAHAEVRSYAEDRGLVGCPRPFPHDLYDQLLCAEGTPIFSDTPPDKNLIAAEDGRRG